MASPPPSNHYARAPQRPSFSHSATSPPAPQHRATPQSSHPLRQTSFPVAGGLNEPTIYSGARSARSETGSFTGSLNDVHFGGRSGSVVSFSGASGILPGEKKRGKGRPRKDKKGGSVAGSTTGGKKGDAASVRTGRADSASLVGGQGGAPAEGEEDDEEEDDFGGDQEEDASFKSRMESYKMKEAALVSYFEASNNHEHVVRHTHFKRCRLKKDAVRRITNATLSQSVNPPISTVVNAYTKVFLGDVIDKAVTVQQEWAEAWENGFREDFAKAEDERARGEEEVRQRVEKEKQEREEKERLEREEREKKEQEEREREKKRKADEAEKLREDEERRKKIKLEESEEQVGNLLMKTEEIGAEKAPVKVEETVNAPIASPSNAAAGQSPASNGPPATPQIQTPQTPSAPQPAPPTLAPAPNPSSLPAPAAIAPAPPIHPTIRPHPYQANQHTQQNRSQPPSQPQSPHPQQNVPAPPQQANQAPFSPHSGYGTPTSQAQHNYGFPPGSSYPNQQSSQQITGPQPPGSTPGAPHLQPAPRPDSPSPYPPQHPYQHPQYGGRPGQGPMTNHGPAGAQQMSPTPQNMPQQQMQRPPQPQAGAQHPSQFQRPVAPGQQYQPQTSYYPQTPQQQLHHQQHHPPGPHFHQQQQPSQPAGPPDPSKIFHLSRPYKALPSDKPIHGILTPKAPAPPPGSVYHNPLQQQLLSAAHSSPTKETADESEKDKEPMHLNPHLGPLLPCHLLEALRRIKASGEGQGVGFGAQSLNWMGVKGAANLRAVGWAGDHQMGSLFG